MPQIIYTDNVIGDNGKPINTTPAGVYAIADMSTILSCIERGELVCGTGNPYPVDWNDDDNPPWSSSNNMNPWKHID